MKIALRNRQKGIALIIVMVVIIVISVIAAGFAYSMKVEMTLARNSNNDADLEWLGRSGIELARYVLALQTREPNANNFESLNQKWAGGPMATNEDLINVEMTNHELGDGVFSVKITDLERKFNINLADQTVFQQAMTVMGVEATEAGAISDAVLDWRDLDDDPHLNGAESDYYTSLPVPYLAKNGPIDEITELLMIKGITPEIFWGPGKTNEWDRMAAQSTAGGPQAIPDVTAATNSFGMVDLFETLGSGRININTAPAGVMQLIPGLTPTMALAVIQHRAGIDGMDGTEDDMPFRSVNELSAVAGFGGAGGGAGTAQLSRYFDVRSHTFKVEVDAEVRGTKRHFVGIVRRNPRALNDFLVVKFYWE
ncbi:MAG: exported protein of unknown function [Verrucomicrobiales bacterium]|nr:exported protein of unknown function [Verrucomicrobiales bacterium]